ncbi:MAG: 2-oxoglutarate dehydrogenase complex dihydrolipoyllysine-residue succinyltransferase [Sphingomonadaceae bacterium]|nr:2-oxoglutarate dehydrogenase complex dihydrolipoyllysine-residue succinyltransferase [Sphingomonadaceae bacterium]
MSTDVIIPPLGESITEATVGQWLKAPGDPVRADEPIVSLETDKVAVEVPAPVAGTLSEQLAKPGDTVNVGSAIARIEAGAGAAAPEAEQAKAPAATAPAAAAAAPTGGADGKAHDALSPAVRRVVEERGLDPARIAGSGPDGRITKADALAAQPTAASPLAPSPAAQPSSQPGGRVTGTPQAGQGEGTARREERVRMTRLRQTIARRLKEAQNTAAMLTTFNDVDMGAVMAARDKYKDVFEKKHGVRLGFMSFFARASVFALNEVPAVNARIDGDEIVYHQYADLGIAVSSPGGLVVPVLRNAQALGFADTEKAIADFGRRARDGQLKLEELQGGTFTISNGGVFGSLMSTPILNPPQSGVLGLHRIEERPVARGGQVVIRPMMYLALSYDHRIVDGREAVTFLVRVKEAIEDPVRLLIDL